MHQCFTVLLAGVEPSSFSSEVIPFPPQALTSDASEGSPAVSVCVAETDASKECICHLEVRKLTLSLRFVCIISYHVNYNNWPN